MSATTGAAPTDPIQAPGTPEATWREWQGLAELAPCPLADLGSVLVLAAHPDDEILGFGGTLALLNAAGTRVHVVVATDGEASHPGSPTLTPRDLAALRRREDTASLAKLGLEACGPTRLALSDGGLAAHEEELTAAVGGLIDAFDLCVAPWIGDVHPDHECVGRAAASAAAAAGRAVWHYPVWMWHWAEPADPRVPWHRGARIELPPRTRAAKNAAITCHQSQILPLSPAPEDAAILPDSDLEHFRRGFEVVFR